MKIVNRRRADVKEQAHSGAAEFAERLFAEMLGVMGELDRLIIKDFDLTSLKKNVVLPVAHYLYIALDSRSQAKVPLFPLIKSRAALPHHVKPIFLSGKPGIGKTTLLMVLDEALYRLGRIAPWDGIASLRDMVASGYVRGFFAEKGSMLLNPLQLFGKPTAALSARDWNNVLRHWTYDEVLSRQSNLALEHFVRQMMGKVVIVDEAEIEGYVYFTEVLAQRGVLIVLSSNLPLEFVHLDPSRVSVVPLDGPDHRTGDLASVCVPHDNREWFAHCTAYKRVTSPLLAGAEIDIGEVRGRSAICLEWNSLKNRPLLKNDFAKFLILYKPSIILLDGVPFFRQISADDIDLPFLGHLARFVNLIDAIHDCHVQVVVRSLYPGELDEQVVGPIFQATLAAYDSRTGNTHGEVAWIEWLRCLSRLKSLRPSELM